MKIQSLFTKAFGWALICIAVVVVTIFRLSPSFAASKMTTQPAQLLATPIVIAQSDSERSGGRSLYNRLGGYNAIAAVIDSSAQYIFNDPQIGKYFIGLSTNSKQRLRQLLVDQFCQVAGGPCVYTGRTMKLSHTGIGAGLKNIEFDAFANDVGLGLDKNGVKLREKMEVLSFVNSLRGEIVEK
jgi:hemoglobin